MHPSEGVFAPDLSNAYHNRGSSYSTLGKKQSAIVDYDQVINLNPNFANAYYNRGVALKALGNNPGSVADFQKAIELYKKQGNDEYWLKAALECSLPL
jgi:tetratricopeptide (TPR) repeat protein